MYTYRVKNPLQRTSHHIIFIYDTHANLQITITDTFYSKNDENVVYFYLHLNSTRTR